MADTSETNLNDVINKPEDVENDANSLATSNSSEVRPSEVSSLAIVEEIIRDMASIFDFLKPQLVLENGADEQTTLTSSVIAPEISSITSDGETFTRDFHQLQVDFSKICCDYSKSLESEMINTAIEFCSKIIHEVEPESRKFRRQQGNITWTFKFPHSSENQLQMKTAFVTNFEKEGIYYEPLKNNNTIVLSLKQAGVLAMHTFCKIIDHSSTRSSPIYLFTPLAGSIFCRNDIDKIAQELKITIPEVLKAVNCSCQDGGEYLEASEVYIAAVAAIPDLKKLKNQKSRGAILRGLLKRYTAMKKEWNLEKFKIYAANSLCMMWMPDLGLDGFNALLEDVKKIALFLEDNC